MSTLQDLLVRVGADVSSFVNGMTKAAGSAAAFGAKMDAMGKKSMATGRTLSLGLTLPIVGIGYKAIKAASDFEKGMNTMAAVADVPVKQMKELDALAVKLGQDTIFSTQEAADAMLELAKGGLTTAQIQAGALATTLDLAAASDMELAESATILSNAMNTFGLTGKDSVRVADALAGAANQSSADIGDMAYALQAGGASAARFNLSVEETSAVLALLADRGIKGSDAGTLLKSQLRTLVPVTEKAKDKMKELGIDFFDAQGRFIGLTGMANELKTELGKLTQEQRELAIAQLFGSDASRLAGILAKEGATGLREYMEATTDAGAASDVATAKMKGLPGALEQMKGSIETAFLALGRAIAPTIESIAKKVTELVNAFTSLPKSTQQVIATGLAIAAALGPVMFIFGGLARTAGKLTTAIGKVGMAFGSTRIADPMTAAMRDIDRAAANATARLQVMATVGAIALVNFAMSFARAGQEAEALVTKLDGSIAGTMEFDEQIKTITDDSSRFGRKVSDAFGAVLTGAPTATQEFNALRDQAAALRDTMTDLGPAGATIAKAKAELIDTKLTAQEIATTFGSTIDEIPALAQAVAKSESDYRQAMFQSGVATAETTAATERLIQTRNRLAGISDGVLQNEINQQRAQRALAQAQRVVNQMQQEGTDKGAKYKDALLNLKQAQVDVRNTGRSLSTSINELRDNVAGAAHEGRASTQAYLQLGQQYGFTKKQLKGFVTDLPNGSRKLSDMAGKLGVGTAATEALHGALEILQTGFSKTTGKAKAEFGKLPGIVTTAGANAANAAQGAGANITNGIASGIEGALGSVIASVNSVVDAAVDAANQRSKSKSPSRLFAEVGKNLSLGMALGMRQAMGDVEQASGELIAAAAGGRAKTRGPGSEGSSESVYTGSSRGRTPHVTFVTRGKPDKRFAKESLEELEWTMRTEPFSGG